MQGKSRPLVALLESRMSSEMARLVEKHGGRALSVPALVEVPELSQKATQHLIEQLEAGRFEIIVFMTGVSVSLLFELADQMGQRAALVNALKRLTTVCRGPKPAAALRGFGVPATLTARDPYTSAELIDALSDIDLAARRVLLMQCGQSSETLGATLLARGAELDEFWLYRWRMPTDESALAGLVESLVSGSVDALAVTCQIQVRHLFEVAERMNSSAALLRALNERVVVGAVGITCDVVLQSFGVRPRVVPEHPKMGPLVAALMRHVELSRRDGAAPAPLLH